MRDRMQEKSGTQPESTAQRERLPVPQGYRQGLITAITVLLGFSLAFFRFWGFEASGAWTLGSIVSACTFVVAVALQIFALFRSLRIEDDDQEEYRKTVMWFIASAVVLLVDLLIALVVFSGLPEQG